MKITYQVNIDVEKSVEADWLTWMTEKHIPGICEVANVSDVLFIKYNDNEVEKHANFRVIYLFDTKEDLDQYLENHAETLRADHNKMFGSFTTIQRRVGVLLKWIERA